MNRMLFGCFAVMLLYATAIAEPPSSAPASAPATQSSAATRPSPDQEMVSISFRDAPVDQLFIFISEKVGKPVIPQDSVKQKRITVVSSKQQTLSDAMQIIAEALRQNGIVMEESPRVINMKSLADAKQSLLAVIPPEQSVLTLTNKAAVVHKLFELRYFDVGKMKDVVLPMLPDFGHVMADPNTRRLMVTDTVEDLERIEQIVQSLDVAQAEQTIKKIIVVKQGDASDIVATVRVLIASSLSSQARDVAVSGGHGGASPSSPPGGGSPSSPTGPSESDTPSGGSEGPSSGAGPKMRAGPGGPSGPTAHGAPAGAASGVFLEENKVPVVLMADVQRNWIIAVASKRMMDMIEEWVAKLDIPASATDSQFDVLELKHADMEDVSRQISQVIDAMPAGDARQSVRLVPFAQSRKILVTGSKRGRDMVRGLIAQLDQEAGNQSMRVFQLENADAEDVAQDIEELYGGKKESGGYGYFSDYFSSRNRGTTPQRVKVTADTRRNAIIVISDTAMLEEIQKLLKEQWDLPLSEKEAQPKIYTLKHVDPVKLKDMLEELFFKKKARRSESGYFYDYMMDMASSRDDQPVGRLYGQFRFQAMADSNRLLVVAKNTASYAVMDALITQLDQPQDAGTPQMIELKHANAEDLAEQLNATLAEPGTLAEILRAKRDLAGAGRQNGLPPSARTGEQNTAANAANAQAQQQQGGTSPNAMTFWWQRAPRRVDEKPTSNLIGKIRFVPINRRNALLVVAPQAYVQPIHDLVEELDQPGMQVMIHATIAEVQSDDTSTLGIRLASDPSIFRDSRLMDNSVGGGGNLSSNNIISGTPGANHNNAVFSANLNFNVLLQLLIRNFGLKILFEPKLYTADNQEAEFFDGQDVPFQTQAQSSPEGATVVQSFNYTPVGTYLRIRPHITNEKDVDLTINLQLSSIVPGQTSFGNFIFDRRETTTHVIIGDGETVMLSGIIRQELSKDVRKIPLLGDIPLLGALFRSTDRARSNRELIAFITPHVIRRENEPAAANSYRQWIQNLRQELNAGKTPPSTSPAPEEKPASRPAAQ